MLWSRRSGQRLGTDMRMTECRICAADCVIPTEWAKQGEDNWRIHLRCGECGASREVVVSDAAAQRYDWELDRGMHEIVRALDRLEREEMAKEAEAFATALELDLVDPDDFDR